MRTVRSAAMLLSAASSIERLQPILAGLGFDDGCHPIDTTTRAALRIPADFRELSIARGAGALRAFVATAPPVLGIRDATMRAASRLASSAPHILWLLVVMDAEREQLALAAWAGGRTPPGIAALIVERSRVVDSDGETLAALAAARGGLDVLTHTRWLEILGRESVTRRFYRSLERVVHGFAGAVAPHGTTEERTELALLCVSRLLFLSFLEAKGWLAGDRAFLARGFDGCLAGGGNYHRRVLLPLFHGTLNTRFSARAPAARAFGRVPFLNGGLFARTATERRYRGLLFPDSQFGILFGDLLGRYRFTAREDSATWSEAAIDPEMLGKAFESIMASRERRDSGAYFTPHALVDRVTTGALRHAIAESGVDDAEVEALLRGDSHSALRGRVLRDRLERIRVLDPACGSGAFLVHTLERLSAMLVVLG
ncbi:MAG TPA: DNA methyltransferase, partial [Thermoanaerobaculia bacterium]